MLRSVRIAIVLGALAVSPALPDIVDVAVNGSVSGSGSVTVECGVGLMNPPPGCVEVYPGLYLKTTPFSFSATNSGQLMYSDSVSQPPGLNPLLQAFPYQTTSPDIAGPGTLEIDLGDDYSDFGLVNFQLLENDSISAAFDLTQESMLSLVLVSEFGGATGSAELLDSDGNVIATLPSAGSTAFLDLLAAGAYQLDFSMSGGAEGSYNSNTGGDFQASLFATATPIPEPEPRWTLLAVMLGVYVVFRRQRVR